MSRARLSETHDERLLVFAALCSLVISMPAAAQRLRASPADKAAIDACIEHVRRNLERPVESRSDPLPGDVEGWLARAARDTATKFESCLLDETARRAIWFKNR